MEEIEINQNITYECIVEDYEPVYVKTLYRWGPTHWWRCYVNSVPCFEDKQEQWMGENELARFYRVYDGYELVSLKQNRLDSIEIE